jgi:DNA-binding GntR family transcriptional regulator
LAKKSFINLVEADPAQAGYRTLIERTYGQLREDILSGALAPGEKLLVEHLKLRYAVGAGTVREAISRLVSEAMVVAEGQRGFTVTPISLEDLSDVTNVRVAVETDALRSSIRSGDDFWRNRLCIAYDQLSALEQPLEDENVRRWEQANAEFHEALLSACGSPWTLRVVRQLTQHAERVGATVDQVAQEVERVAAGRKIEGVEQTLQGRVAALDVADQINRHADIVGEAGRALIV